MGIGRKFWLGIADITRVPVALGKDIITMGGRKIVEDETYTAREFRRMRQEEEAERLVTEILRGIKGE